MHGWQVRRRTHSLFVNETSVQSLLCWYCTAVGLMPADATQLVASGICTIAVLLFVKALSCVLLNLQLPHFCLPARVYDEHV